MENENEYLNMDSMNNGKRPEKNEKEKRGYFYSGLVVGLAAALLIVSVVYLGTRIQNLVNVKEQQAESARQEQQAAEAGSVLTQEMVQKIQMVEAIIKQFYYTDDIDRTALEEGAYRGMVASLGDPYSEYYSQEELADIMDQSEGIYYGIGAGVQLDKETMLPMIVKVYPQTPAEEAGLRENDIIYEVNDESTSGLSVQEVVTRIKGEEGTTVNLTIVREGEGDFLSIDVERRKVNTITVDFKMLEDDQAYIQISEFDSVTTDQFAEALAMARGNHMKGLIVDLRSNPGGNLDTVVQIAQMLLPEGLVVYTEDKYGERIEYSCDGKRQLEVPLVVLINGNSASASEILAGAVKDYGIGTLVGTTTFGKGIVQRIAPMKDDSAVKITTSRYFTPKGNNIHGIGIEPDIECIFDGEAYYNDPARPDNQLDEAKRVLKELMEK